MEVLVVAVTLFSTVAPLPDGDFSDGRFGLSSVYGAPHAGILQGDGHFLGLRGGDGRAPHAGPTAINVHSRGSSGAFHPISYSDGSGVSRFTPSIFRESTLHRGNAIHGASQSGNFHDSSPISGNAFGVSPTHGGGIFDGGHFNAGEAIHPGPVRGVSTHGGSFHGNAAHGLGGDQGGNIHRGSPIHGRGPVHGGSVIHSAGAFDNVGSFHDGGVVHGNAIHGVGPIHGGVTRGTVGGFGGDIVNDYSGSAYYSFDYTVQDDYTNNYFGHSESRDGHVTKGKYFVHLPDGRLQTVTYTADEYGYHPVVTYEGTAHHDPPAPVHAGGGGGVVHASPVQVGGGHVGGVYTNPVHAAGGHASVHTGGFAGGIHPDVHARGFAGAHPGNVHAGGFAGGVHPGDVHLRGIHAGIGHASRVYSPFS